MKSRYIVICRADSTPSFTDASAADVPGEYVIATHRWFWSRGLAYEYAATIHPSREPIVVEAYKDLRND